MSVFGPDTTWVQLGKSQQALEIINLHLPGLADLDCVALQPFEPLVNLAMRMRGVGDAPIDLTPLWAELAQIPSDERAAPRPPVPNLPVLDVDTTRARSSIRATEFCERWGVAELRLSGPTDGNPFVDVEIAADFVLEETTVHVPGFYNGEGEYVIRFSPPHVGAWSFNTLSNVPALSNHAGVVQVGEPGIDNHGPVQVREQFHFQYADGTPYLPFGTTAYAWLYESEGMQERTLETLSQSSFTKLRMCIFPKSFDYNWAEPSRFPFVKDAAGEWDFSRFDLQFFDNLEQRIRQLDALGIQADLILFHPYDRWGFSRMPSWADQHYASYVVRRLAAYSNVWWSLANEYDFMRGKTLDDWELIARTIVAEDHASRLTSVHNGLLMFDHTRPWVTHCSIQKNENGSVASLTDSWREAFGKPVVIDEIGYEGNLPWGWGNLTAQELVLRAWEGAVRGSYVNHGETFHSDGPVWWSHGGDLTGESPARFRFLQEVISQIPSGRMEPLTSDFDSACGGDDTQRFVYFGESRPLFREFALPLGSWDIDVVDTWNMTISAVGKAVERKIYVPLGSRYLAVRFTRCI